MNKSTVEFKDYIVQDVLGHVEGVIARGMFGGYGLYLPDEEHGKIMFGGIIEDELYFRSDDEHKKTLLDLEGKQFIYDGHKTRGPVAMPWYSVTEELLENREVLTKLVYEGYEIALANKKPKKVMYN